MQCVTKAGAGHNTESQATNGTITKAFTVADKTFEPQAFVFRIAVLIKTLTASTYVPVQEGRVGQLHTCMACLLVAGPIRSAIGTQRNRCYACAISCLATGCCCATRLHLSAVDILLHNSCTLSRRFAAR